MRSLGCQSHLGAWVAELWTVNNSPFHGTIGHIEVGTFFADKQEMSDIRDASGFQLLRRKIQQKRSHEHAY